jgi:signal transduction histidine kinase
MVEQFNNIDSPFVSDEVTFSSRELLVLNEIATVMSSATDIADVYSAFSALVADVIDWDGIILNVPCDDGRNFKLKVREGTAIKGRISDDVFEIKGSLFGEVLKTRQTQVISVSEGQTAEWALKIPHLRGPLLAGVRSWMATPLISHGNFIGAMYVQSLSTDAFNDHHRMLFERIALFVAPTVERFGVYEELARDSRHTKSLLRIGRMLLAAHDFDDVMQQFTDELKTIITVDRMAIAVAQADGEAVVDRYMYGVPVEGYAVNNVIPMDELQPNGLDVSSHGYIMPENALVDADPISAPGLHANAQAGLKSAMFAGLRADGNLVGTVNVKSLESNAYSASDLEYFEQVADHVAAAIERTRSHASEIEMGRATQERIRTQQEALRVVDVIQAKERLLSSASHELRTPLTGILAFVDLLARNRGGNLDDKQLRYLSIVRRNAEDLSGKVNSLIDHAARDAGQLTIKLGSFDLASMLREAITDALPNLSALGQKAKLEVGEDIEVVGDRRHLLVALAHLIDNATRYAPENSDVRIAGEIVDGNVEITIADQGVGVGDEHAEGIFDPFERGELTGMASSPGAGLGLTYVRAVAVAHGGDALYESIPGSGAKFTIRIPARTGTQADD